MSNQDMIPISSSREPNASCHLPFIPHKVRTKIYQLAAIVSISLPLKTSASETIAQEATSLLTKLNTLVLQDPTNANKTMDFFLRRIVDRDSNGIKPSIAAQLTNEELIKLAANVGKVVPTKQNIILTAPNGRLLRALNEELPAHILTSENVEEALIAISKCKSMQLLIDVIQNPNNEQRGAVFLSISKRLHRVRTEFGSKVAINENGKTELADRTKESIIPTNKSSSNPEVTHINQVHSSKYCVSACVLMTYSALIGQSLTADLLPHIASLESDRAESGKLGLNTKAFLSQVGLNTEWIDFAEGANIKSRPQAMIIAQTKLQSVIAPALQNGKYVVLSVNHQLDGTHHAILITNYSSTGKYLVHDPMKTPTAMTAQEISRAWSSISVPDILKCGLISLTTPATLGVKNSVSLQLTPELKSIVKTELEFKEGISLESLKASTAGALSWQNMTARWKKKRDVESVSALALLLKLQNAAGQAVQVLTFPRKNKGEFILVHGFTGGLNNPTEGTFNILTKNGAAVVPWDKLSKMIVVPDNKGNDAIFFGYHQN